MAEVTTAPLIAVIDDDPAVAEAIVSLMESVGFRCLGFGSAEDFLASGQVAGIACVILDVLMPGMDGLELQRRLAPDRNTPPIVFITACCDPEVANEALRRGAVAFLLKPFSDKSVLHAVRSAVGAPAKSGPN